MIIRLAITAVILALLARGIDFGESARAIGAIDLRYLALVLGLVAIDRSVMIWRWILLLRARDIKISAIEAARLFLVSSFVGSFLPAGIGGDAARAYGLSKDVASASDMLIDDEQRTRAQRDAVLDTPVMDFELSVRSRNALKKMNIQTLGDLLRVREADLLAFKNFGETSLVEIKTMLSNKGLRLGQGLDDAHRAARRAIADTLKGSGKEAMLGKPVSDLQLSVRARKALQLLDIQTLGDLASRTEAELMGVKNFGATSLSEVKERLAEHGLGLRTLEA